MVKTAIFAGGCFWCMVRPFDETPGIKQVISGYTGGHTVNPTYEQVKAHLTGHTEAIKIVYDPAIISYSDLIALYWQQTDPTDAMGQFQDRGDNYRPIIFVADNYERKIAEDSRHALATSGRFDQPIVTKIEAVQPFYPAEPEHQEFYKHHPQRYQEEIAKRKKFTKNNWRQVESVN
ncbi:peptide-methionine (S)-S-oxide reductase [Loigolactobacillus backii]|uniref:peptide-methionine (S)-S-oxide reductase MsrA n=1 Tax=Loigolactobacillus backii TaxID=375175 RepID=UPI0007F0A602|nr:peptide-methionine (S)-S-oxide reductase MsrA [Loigolactobacillus backii]ANK60342.1 peptide-methionine (S)-S-oxide reductase [Loigolactobacillus backii]ANK65223.1 peptide-methionine (S)-S-oxide reductase [Loigolactobacillus backii]ANK67781.1 peptide-methionine (S)-S-oxide reductase [Loigolactobacillus backii]OLF70462.1 methionine sulfoxide reductase A [Loigolactobacillus backii]PIO86991.1 peptide-methionine (S)-S-oxide reductase [Loigolactobacillus backii]